MEENKNFDFKLIEKLSCGENEHQKAGLFQTSRTIDWNLIQGLNLSYNDILNSSVALEVVAEFFDVAALAIINHANPSAVALGADTNQAWQKAFDSNPICAFKSTIATTKEVSAILAKKLLEVSPKVILAPSFCDKALEILSKDNNIKLIQVNTELKNILNFSDEEIKITPFGALIQEKDKKDLDVNSFKVVTKRKPEQKEAEDMIFAFKIAKHTKSSSAIVAKDLRTLAIAASEANGEDSAQLALDRVCDSAKDSVLALDCSFNSINVLQIAAQNRVSGIIQPLNGSQEAKEKEFIEYANKMNLSMISTGISHIKH